MEPENIDAWINYSNFLFDNNSKLEALAEGKANKFNKNNFDLKLRLVAMKFQQDFTEAKLSLIEMQSLNKNTLNQLLEIYPQLLKDKSTNDFFEIYKDDSIK